MVIAIQGRIADASNSVETQNSITPDVQWTWVTSRLIGKELAEGARFELAAHEVGAGFQDRWIKPLSHPSENEMDDLR